MVSSRLQYSIPYGQKQATEVSSSKRRRSGARPPAYSSTSFSLHVWAGPYAARRMRPPASTFASTASDPRRRAPDGPRGLRGVHLLGRAAVYAAHVRAAVSSLVCPVAALVLDLFCTPLVDVARELATPAYV